MDWDLTSLCISIGIFDLAPSSLVFRLAVVFQFRPRMQIRFQALHAAVKNMILNGSKLELAALGFPPKKLHRDKFRPADVHSNNNFGRSSGSKPLTDSPVGSQRKSRVQIKNGKKCTIM